MQYAICTADGGIVLQDEDIYRKFDRYGKYVSDISLTPSLVNSKQEVNIISVLTTSGGTDILKVYGDTVSHYSGSVHTVIEVMSRKGYTRMLTQKGSHEGVAFTQTIFVYDRSVNPCI